MVLHSVHPDRPNLDEGARLYMCVCVCVWEYVEGYVDTRIHHVVWMMDGLCTQESTHVCLHEIS